MKNYEMCITQEQVSPPRKASLASEASSEDRMRPSAITARHTSKDTVASAQGKSKKGRRYHDVNKSDVLTPNSPRRYQEYFKSYQQRPTTAGPTGMPAISHSSLVTKPNLILPPPNKAPKAQKYTQENNYQNHRYSPSNTKSVADES